MEIKKGIGVSPGVAISTAFVLDAEEVPIPQRHVEPGKLKHEVARLRKATAASKAEIIEHCSREYGVLREASLTKSALISEAEALATAAPLPDALMEGLVFSYPENTQGSTAVAKSASLSPGVFARFYRVLETSAFLVNRSAMLRKQVFRLAVSTCFSTRLFAVQAGQFF